MRHELHPSLIRLQQHRLELGTKLLKKLRLSILLKARIFHLKKLDCSEIVSTPAILRRFECLY